jgi:hypothetical protein
MWSCDGRRPSDAHHIQLVTLQHVSVAEGGQAIVGNVTQAPRENGQEKAATPPPVRTDTAANMIHFQCGASQTNERRSQAQHGADAFQSALRR